VANLEKIPPQNLDAEQAVLGSLLLDKDAMIKVVDVIVPTDFYKEDHATIFSAMLALFEKRQPIDVLTVTEALERQKQLKQIGGASYLTSLVNSVVTSAHIRDYGEIIAQKALLRRLISVGGKITELAFEEKLEPPQLLDEAEKSLFSVSQKYLKEAFVPVKDILSQTFERIDELHKHKGMLRGVPTGFKSLDNILAGLQPSDLIVLAARPSMGKTSLALSIACNATVKNKTPVGVFSLEMSKEQVVDRLLCNLGALDSWKLRTGNLTDEDFPKIGYAMGVLSEAPLFIDDSPILTVSEIRAKARRLQVEHGLGLVIVDYLQLLESSRRNTESRVQEVSEISRNLKALAREISVPVIAVSQLSRAVEARHPQIPQLADLRESGSIEQDADVVAFIYREEYYDSDTERKNIADIFIKKHRNGPTGQIELYFVPEQMKFNEIEKKREASPPPGG